MQTARTHGAPTGQVLVVTRCGRGGSQGSPEHRSAAQKHDHDKLRSSKGNIKFDISVKDNFGANRGGKRKLMYFISFLETVVRLQCRRRVCRCGSQASPPATCHIKSGDPGRLKRGVAQARETLAPVVVRAAGGLSTAPCATQVVPVSGAGEAGKQTVLPGGC